MQIEQRKLSELHPNEKNVRIHNQHQIEEFKKSVQSWDVLRPIVIDENGMILVGHGLYMTLLALGKETADVIVKRGLSERDKNKLMLSDNKIYSLGLDNYGAIEEILKSMDGDFEIPGYDADTLEELYGVKSVEAEIPSIPSSVEVQPADGKMDVEPAKEPASPTEAVSQARQEAIAQAGRYIICPHCGERIDL